MTKRDTAPRAQRGIAPVRLPVNTVDDISFQIGELSSRIARRAYDCFEARGGQPGNDLGDWLPAEEELVLFVPVPIPSPREHSPPELYNLFCSLLIKLRRFVRCAGRTRCRVLARPVT